MSAFFLIHRPPGIHTYRLEYFHWVIEWFDEHMKAGAA